MKRFDLEDESFAGGCITVMAPNELGDYVEYEEAEKELRMAEARGIKSVRDAVQFLINRLPHGSPTLKGIVVSADEEIRALIGDEPVSERRDK